MTEISVHSRQGEGPLIVGHPMPYMQIQDNTQTSLKEPTFTVQLFDESTVIEVHFTADHLEFLLRCLYNTPNPMVSKIWENFRS